MLEKRRKRSVGLLKRSFSLLFACSVLVVNGLFSVSAAEGQSAVTYDLTTSFYRSLTSFTFDSDSWTSYDDYLKTSALRSTTSDWSDTLVVELRNDDILFRSSYRYSMDFFVDFFNPMVSGFSLDLLPSTLSVNICGQTFVSDPYSVEGSAGSTYRYRFSISDVSFSDYSGPFIVVVSVPLVGLSPVDRGSFWFGFPCEISVTSAYAPVLFGNLGLFFTQSIKWLGDVLNIMVAKPALLILCIAMPVVGFVAVLFGRLSRTG